MTLDECPAFIAHARKGELPVRRADNFADEVIDPDILDSDAKHEDDFITRASSDDDFYSEIKEKNRKQEPIEN